MDSQQPGTYHDDHKQWQSIKKLRTAVSNNERASFRNAGVAMVADDNLKSQKFQEGGTSFFWFNRFYSHKVAPVEWELMFERMLDQAALFGQDSLAECRTRSRDPKVTRKPQSGQWAEHTFVFHT